MLSCMAAWHRWGHLPQLMTICNALNSSSLLPYCVSRHHALPSRSNPPQAHGNQVSLRQPHPRARARALSLPLPLSFITQTTNGQAPSNIDPFAPFHLRGERERERIESSVPHPPFFATQEHLFPFALFSSSFFCIQLTSSFSLYHIQQTELLLHSHISFPSSFY